MAGITVTRAGGGAWGQEQILRTAQGIVTEPFSRYALSTSSAPTAGRLVASLVPYRAGDVVSKLAVQQATAGSSNTLVRLGIYSAAGDLLASTANASATFASGTDVLQAIALSSAWACPADGGYYHAFLSVGGTSPSIARVVSVARPLVTGFPALAMFQASQTDLPATWAASVDSTPNWIAGLA